MVGVVQSLDLGESGLLEVFQLEVGDVSVELLEVVVLQIVDFQQDFAEKGEALGLFAEKPRQVLFQPELEVFRLNHSLHEPQDHEHLVLVADLRRVLRVGLLLEFLQGPSVVDRGRVEGGVVRLFTLHVDLRELTDDQVV